MAKPSAVNRLIAVRICVPEPNIKGKEMVKKVYETFHINDECYTPDYAVFPLLKYLDKFKNKTIWCPFDTDESEYVKILKANGFNVIYSHKDDGQNFYDFGDGLFAQDVPEFDLIVSNPPFHNKAKLVEKIVAFNKPFALLLPMTWLNDKAPFTIFSKNGLELMLFDRRVIFKNCGNQPSFGVGYYCRGILPEKIVFEKLGG